MPPSSNEMEPGEAKALGHGTDAVENAPGTKLGGELVDKGPKDETTSAEARAGAGVGAGENEAKPAEPSKPDVPAVPAATAGAAPAKGDPKETAGETAGTGSSAATALADKALGSDVELQAPPRSGSDPPAETTPIPSAPTPKKKAATTTAAGAALPSAAEKAGGEAAAPSRSSAGNPSADAAAEPSGGPLVESSVSGGNSSGGKDTGAAATAGREGEGGLSPTPPRTRSNPIGRGTPPRRGSRGGNLAICTQQQPSFSPGREDGMSEWSKPTSPRSRPRDQPLVRAKVDAAAGVVGVEGDGDGDADAGETTGKVATFSSRRWKASDEYLLDEDR